MALIVPPGNKIPLQLNSLPVLIRKQVPFKLSDIETRPYWEYIVSPVMRDLPMPSEPRYERATRLALIFILTQGITSFPVDPYGFFRKYHIKLKKYSTIARKKGLQNVAEVIRETGSNDGWTVCRKGIVAVSYNDEVQNIRRILFTLLHEIGHIVLGHVFDFESVRFNRGGVENVDVLERQADCFARNVIAPAFAVYEMHCLGNKSSCLSIFGCTNKFWDVRMDLLSADLANTNPQLIPLVRSQLANFMYGATCQRCGAGFIGYKGTRFCPICGGQKLKWKNNGLQYAEHYPLDSDGKALSCPKCQSNQIDQSGLCKACGFLAVNRCANSNCNAIAVKGNSRFCTKCGCQTIFMLQGLLPSWQKEHPALTMSEPMEKV